MAALTSGSLEVASALVLNAIGAGLNETALFIAERIAHASPHPNEASVYLLALAHWRSGEPRAAVEILRRRVVASEPLQLIGFAQQRRNLLGKPANELSVRCAYVYSACCGELGRPREGEEVLARAVSAFGAADFSVPCCVSPSPAALFVRLGRLAAQSGQIEKATAYFTDALRDRWWCWEAYEALCSLGVAPDPDSIFGAAPTRPIPGRPNHGAGSVSTGFFTPAVMGVQTNGYGAGYPYGGAGGFNTSMGFDDSSASLLEPSFFGPSTKRAPAAAAAPSASMFTPDAPAMRNGGGPVAPQKRARPDVIPDEPPAPAARTRSRTTAASKVRSVPPAPPSLSGESNASGPATRRSARLSKENSRDTLGLSNGPPSTSTSASGGGRTAPRTRTVSGNPRDRKRAKAGSDDASMTTLRSSSSPEPPSAFAGVSVHANAQDEMLAEDWLRDAMRRFGRAYWALSRYDCGAAVEAVLSMPNDMRASWRALNLRARARFEMLDYRDAERAFTQARAAAPYLLRGSEYHSTLLWHVNRPNELAVLAQQLQHLDPASAQAWIATGNVFSQLEDHASALRCFQRAAQADASMAYAYTLAGHECVALEEWERALGFFREAIGRDPRHYNAWFGLGNVYLKTARHRMAEYHFREAVRINPSNAMLVCCVGTVMDKLDRRADALVLYEQACALAPDSAAVRFKRVRALVATKQYKLEKLKAMAPNEFNVHFLLGRLHGHLGDRSAMVRHLTYAQDLDPRNAQRVREALEAVSDDRPGDDANMQQ